MEQVGQQIFDFLRQYGYWIILPLMIIEGPMVTVAAAILAKLGAFNVWIVLLLSITGDIIGDIILYFVGRFFGMKFVRKIGKYIGITEKIVLKIENYFKKHGGKTIFTIKSTTGLCWATFVSAGIFKMDFKKFLLYSFLGGVVWSGFLTILGYFYGYLWVEIKKYLDWAGWFVLFMTILTFSAIIFYKKRETKKVMKLN